MAYADLTATEKQELSEFMRNYRAAFGDTVRGLHKQYLLNTSWTNSISAIWAKCTNGDAIPDDSGLAGADHSMTKELPPWVGRGRLNRQGCSMKTRTIVLFIILAALVTMACGSYRGYIVSVSFPADEGWAIEVCPVSNRNCQYTYPAEVIPGSGCGVPPVGTFCRDIGGGHLDCGNYLDLQLISTPN